MKYDFILDKYVTEKEVVNFVIGCKNAIKFYEIECKKLDDKKENHTLLSKANAFNKIQEILISESYSSVTYFDDYPADSVMEQKFKNIDNVIKQQEQ